MKEDDWRLRGQEDYLQNEKFKLINFKVKEGGSLHEHCEFCWHKFMEHCENVDDCSEEGYCSEDDRYWVCVECFKDFAEYFNWETI